MSISFNPRRPFGATIPALYDLDSVNVSNANAADILASLGLPTNTSNPDPFPIEQFEAECETFLRVAAGTEVDDAQPARESGNMVSCERRQGYMTCRISAILAVVREGYRLGATHVVLS